MNRKRFFSVLFILTLVVFFLLPFAVFAQEADNPPAETTPDWLLSIAFAMPLITGVVGLIKFAGDKVPFLEFLQAIPASRLNLALSLVVFGFYQFSGGLGYASQFEALFGEAGQIASGITSVIVMILGSSLLHELSAGAEVPILGYKRA